LGSGILDLKTGRLERVPVAHTTDFHYTAWAPDGRIIGTGLGMDGSLWKFETDEVSPVGRSRTARRRTSRYLR
jgi:hypothetical protein